MKSNHILFNLITFKFRMSFYFDNCFDYFDDCLVPMFIKPSMRRHHNKKSLAPSRNTFSLMLAEDVLPKFGGMGQMDFHESEDAFQLIVDLPGMNKEDIRVHIQDNQLVIEGERVQETERPDDNEKQGGICYYSERQYGAVHRSVSIPPNADMDKVDASYENGVLKIHIPKVECASSVKTITIN